MNAEHIDRVCRKCEYLGIHRDFVMNEIANQAKPNYLTCNKISHGFTAFIDFNAVWYVSDVNFVIPAECSYSLEHLLIYDEKFLPQT